MTETPAQTLRRAAARLRGLAYAALRDIADNDYWADGCPPNGSNDDAYRHGVRDGLGGPGGELAAMFTPGAVLAAADWLDAEADAHEGGMAVSEALCDMASKAGAGEHRIQVAASTLDQALALADKILNEETST